MTNIRQAILKAADHIEANPGEFNFGAWCVPDCGTPGCALGWTGYFAGMERGVTGNLDVARKLLGMESLKFYLRLDDLNTGDWHHNATDCAATLRLYADKYHPATEEYPSIRAELDRIANMQVERAGTG